MHYRNNRRRKKKKQGSSEEELALASFHRNYQIEQVRKKEARLIERLNRKTQRQRVRKPSPVREE